jgi:hypothetical protein
MKSSILKIYPFPWSWHSYNDKEEKTLMYCTSKSSHGREICLMSRAFNSSLIKAGFLRGGDVAMEMQHCIRKLRI